MMQHSVTSLTEDLSRKAQAMVDSGKSYQSIVQEVMMIGGKAIMSKRFTIEQAEYVAASMIAAISLARGVGGGASYPASIDPSKL
ncbi:MAG: hypothetical protein RR068_18360 [Hafnia sp.]